MGAGGEVGGVAALGVVALQAEEVEVVVITDEGGFDDGVEGVDEIFPDCFALNVEIAELGVLVDDHLALGGRYPGGFPGPPFGAYDSPMERFTQEDAPDCGVDLLLFG